MLIEFICGILASLAQAWTWYKEEGSPGSYLKEPSQHSPGETEGDTLKNLLG